MLSIGWPEMMIVAAAALIIVGPRDLPALLRTIGQATGRVRRMSNEFRAELNKVAAMDDVKDIRKSLTAPLNETRSSIESEFNKIGKDGVSPSGKLKPTDPEVESVYDAIKNQTGDIKKPDHAASQASMAAAIAKSREPLAADGPAGPAVKKPGSKAGKTARRPATGTAARKSAARPKSAAQKATPKAKSASARAAKSAANKPAPDKQASAKSKSTRKPAAAKSAAKAPAKPRTRRKPPADKA